MKTLSLTQPWASLIFDGRKRIETRSWGTSYRGLMAIHATKKLDRLACLDAGLILDEVPRGVVLGTVDLCRCERMTQELIDGLEELERAWGDYEIGRWAWILRTPVLFDEPVPALGCLGLWEWTPPALPEIGG